MKDNRQSLLQAARHCLDQRGLARTTARDIAAAAGVSLSAIGYHFGTTEALLQETLLAGVAEWAEVLDGVVSADADAGAAVDLAGVWDRLISSFADYRGVLAASYELVVQTTEHDESRRQLALALERTRRVLAHKLAGVDADLDPIRAHRLGAAHYAIVSGVLTQWLADPAATPDGRQLAAAFAEIGGTIAGRDGGAG